MRISIPFVLLLFPLACASSSTAKKDAGSGGGAGGGMAQAGGSGGSGSGGAGGTGGSRPGTGGADAGSAPSADARPAGGADGGQADAGPAPRDAMTAAGNPHVYISKAGTANVYELDVASGALTMKGMFEGGGYNAVDPKRRFLYAGNGARVIAYAIDPMTGLLTKINETTIPGPMDDGVTHISVHPSGKWVFTAHWTGGRATVIPVMDNGGVGAPTDIVMPGMHSHFITTDKDGKYVFVPGPEAHYIAQYVFDATMGKLKPNDPAMASTPMPDMWYPRHMDWHPSGKYAYVIGETNPSMTSFVYDAATGKLSSPETIKAVTDPAAPMDSNGAHVVVHPSGKFVYGSYRSYDSIALFTVNEMTGRVALVSHEKAGGMIKLPRDFGMDANGKFLLVANQASPGSAILFDINQADGKLTMKGMPIMTFTNPIFASFVYP
jgi:6-phosphogluconolactonase